MFGTPLYEIDLTLPFWGLVLGLLLLARPLSPRLDGVMRWFGSYGLAVGIVFFLFLDTWLGTLAQIEHGLFLAQKMYFESWFTVHRQPVPVIGGVLSIPLPGGQLLMSLLAVNLLVGGVHRVSVKLAKAAFPRSERAQTEARMLTALVALYLGSIVLFAALTEAPNLGHLGGLPLLVALGRALFLARAGARDAEASAGGRVSRVAFLGALIVAHAGVAVLLLAGAVKLKESEEGVMRLFPQDTSAEYTSFHEWEIAIQDASQGTDVLEYLIPQAHFQNLTGERSTRFRAAGVPFELELSHFVHNATVAPKGPMWESATPVVDGWGVLEKERNDSNEYNIAALFARVHPVEPGAPKTDGLLWAAANYPMVVAGKQGELWSITLRRKRYEMPFELELIEFVKNDHARMSMAREYRSDVYVREGDQRRAVRIEMNEPLRKEGFIVFQTNWGPQNDPRAREFYSVFTVVRNPSDKWPEIGMWVLSGAMLVALLIKLSSFLGQQVKRRERQGAALAAAESAEVREPETVAPGGRS